MALTIATGEELLITFTNECSIASSSDDLDEWECPACLCTFSSDDTATSTLSCSHRICSDCIEQQLTAGPPTSRLTFNHLNCPFRCDSTLEDLPQFQHLIQPQVSLREQVRSLALKQLREEGLYCPEKSEQENSANAMEMFVYYSCAKCQCVFFGGAAQCDVPDTEVKLCHSCSGAGRTSCAIHGTEFIEWKCMYCCTKSPVTFTCGSGHYCNFCHTQPGKCRPCVPSDCIFNGKHPSQAGAAGTKGPTYSLGCVMCRQPTSQ
eukprot:c9238_g1_i1.p1 GENE.c9238_g1_i1~~c9238_g1_i1.p1  ORF type:complete len:263 (+),score=21.56 c9238_g1_i1:117-905(+)